MYKYKSTKNNRFRNPVPVPVYNTDGSIKDIFWDAGLQKIDNFGRPIVSVEQSKSVFEGENSKETGEDKSKKIAVAITTTAISNPYWLSSPRWKSPAAFTKPSNNG